MKKVFGFILISSPIILILLLGYSSFGLFEGVILPICIVIGILLVVVVGMSLLDDTSN